MTKRKGMSTEADARQTFRSTDSAGRLTHAAESIGDEAEELAVRTHLRVLPSPAGQEVSQSRKADDKLRELIRSMQKRRDVIRPPEELPPAA